MEKITADEANIIYKYRSDKTRLTAILNKLSNPMLLKIYKIYVGEHLEQQPVNVDNMDDMKKELNELIVTSYLYNQYFSSEDVLMTMKNIIAEEFIRILEVDTEKKMETDFEEDGYTGEENEGEY